MTQVILKSRLRAGAVVSSVALIVTLALLIRGSAIGRVRSRAER